TTPSSTPTPPLSLHAALPIYHRRQWPDYRDPCGSKSGLRNFSIYRSCRGKHTAGAALRRERTIGSGAARHYCRPHCESRIAAERSEEHTSELQSRVDLVCRLL